MRYRRVKVPGAVYFFTINLLNRKQNLLTKHIQVLRMAFQAVKRSHPFEIEGIVVIQDHLHMLMRSPENTSNYSIRINLIKGYFSRRMDMTDQRNQARRYKRERGIWQRRFWEHLIRDEDDFNNHLTYIHYNPVKHGYVINPADWKYSSIHKYQAKGILPPNWGNAAYFDSTEFGDR